VVFHRMKGKVQLGGHVAVGRALGDQVDDLKLGVGEAELSFVEPLLESTTALKVATGIVNIWSAAAKTVAESFHRINTAYPGRFVLGLGVGHPEHTQEYRNPTTRWSTTSTSSTNPAYRRINVCSPRSGRAC